MRRGLILRPVIAASVSVCQYLSVCLSVMGRDVKTTERIGVLFGVGSGLLETQQTIFYGWGPWPSRRGRGGSMRPLPEITFLSCFSELKYFCREIESSPTSSCSRSV